MKLLTQIQKPFLSWGEVKIQMSSPPDDFKVQFQGVPSHIFTVVFLF